MRNNVSKMVLGSMIACSALLVSACGGGDEAGNGNTAMTEMNATDTMLDGTTNDVTAVDAATGADTNMAMDNVATDANMTDTNTSEASDADSNTL